MSSLMLVGCSIGSGDNNVQFYKTERGENDGKIGAFKNSQQCVDFAESYIQANPEVQDYSCKDGDKLFRVWSDGEFLYSKNLLSTRKHVLMYKKNEKIQTVK